MAVLTAQQRNILEKAVIKARNTAEEGAINSLKNLAVEQPEPFAHQSVEQRALRNNLRAKARLLGDTKLPNGSHEIQNLAYELAYEYWHKILFARFLEANNLLMHPTIGVAVTLEEIEELATEEGYADKWDAAATYASKMLPAIFRVNDPLMQIKFAPDDRIALESILIALEPEIFTADDALGWVYQFWQNEAKAAINASGDKIDGKRLPAVTQLFTEPYMVNFLIDNTLGAWWVSRNPGITAPYHFEYLRTLEDGKPAAGTFEGWPDKTAEVTSLDPCMGSGHFVCSLFNVFAALRMHEEGLTNEQATDRVIAENLHGLEIDHRCTQIAAFNLALTAWKFCGHYKELPEMNLACSGIAPKGKVEDWVKLVGKVENENDRYRMENGMRALYNHFQLAPELGSLLDPTTIKADLETASFDQLQPVLKKALENERDNEVLERGVMAAGIAKAGEILSKRFCTILTNVPFKVKGDLSDLIQSFIEKNYINSKSALETVFLERCISLTESIGNVNIVLPQNWLFLKSYSKLRKSLIEKQKWNFLIWLGDNSFQTPLGVAPVLISLGSIGNKETFFVLDVSDIKILTEKIEGINNRMLKSYSIELVKNNPDYRIADLEIRKNNLLLNYANCYQGIITGDKDRFFITYWEQSAKTENWEFIRTPNNSTNDFGGMYSMVFWQNGKGVLHEYAKINRNKLHDMHESGNLAWGKSGVLINQQGELKTTIYFGEKFEGSVSVMFPKTNDDLLPLISYVSSDIYKREVRKIDRKRNVTNATFLKVPFDINHWQKIAAEKYPNGLPKPYSNDPTQWLFHGHPVKSENALQVAVARLLGYRWPAEVEKVEAASSGLNVNDASSILNNNADGSGVYDTLSHEAKQLIQQVKELQLPFDEDGIVCIPPVYSEQSAAERLRQLLQKAWGENWSNSVVADLLKQAGSNKTNLEDWLRDEFFTNHCKVFKNRPFIWHIWDGRKDGFSALVNYHKLDKETLKKLIYTYLGDWIRQCEAKRKAGESGADGLLIAALKLKEKLELILVGEQPFDIFVRWKKLEEQPIGWEPDLNDGVRLNIRPFVEAGVLRSRFNIKWGIDRGKNPAGSPWGEIRDNDRHLSLEEKRVARENKL